MMKKIATERVLEKQWTLKDLEDVSGEMRAERAMEMLRQRKRRRVLADLHDGAYD